MSNLSKQTIDGLVKGFINSCHKWVVFTIRQVQFWKALISGSGDMLPKQVVGLFQVGRTTRYLAYY